MFGMGDNESYLEGYEDGYRGHADQSHWITRNDERLWYTEGYYDGKEDSLAELRAQRKRGDK